jgi:putative methionine-R-sulfoxide reductase with GAF domain/ribosomal protein L37E
LRAPGLRTLRTEDKRLASMADEFTHEPSETAKSKPAFDEDSLAKLLEAAYVLQEHNRELAKMELRPRPDESSAAETSSQRLTTATAKDDYTGVLAQIVETQHQIQVRHLSIDPAMALIVQRIVDIAKAAGASVGILDGRNLRYRATAGFRTLPLGTEVLLEKALCAASLRVGDVIRCADVNPEFLIDAAECKRRGIQSLICVPIYHDGNTAGGLEVYYSTTNAFSERDVHTCQLMAGLVTEALARNEEISSKNSIAAERAVMIDAIEKIKPNLAALVDSAKAPAPPAPAPVTASTVMAHPAPPVTCRKCGHQLLADEQFCGECGSPRAAHSNNYETPSMQSKLASMLSMQEAAKKNSNGAGANGSSAVSGQHDDRPSDDHQNDNQKTGHTQALRRENIPAAENLQVAPSASSLADAAENELPELFRLPEPAAARTGSQNAGVSNDVSQQISGVPHQDTQAGPSDLTVLPAEDENNQADAEPESESEAETALVKSGSPTPWSSAAAAREFLERIAGNKHPGSVIRSGALARFLSARRGDVYLLLAVVLVACAIRWGIWSNHSVSATGNSPAAAAHRRPDSDLPFFDWVLVKVGLAEPPDAPEDKGNPDTQVWVDLQTALYYCPGSDLYGKTPKGKFEKQSDAQLDQFESASRKACR